MIPIPLATPVVSEMLSVLMHSPFPLVAAMSTAGAAGSSAAI